MRLDGLSGSHLFGFMATLGTLTLLDDWATARNLSSPRISFDRDGTPMLSEFTATAEEVAEAAFAALLARRPFYEAGLSQFKKPTDFSAAEYATIAATAGRTDSNVLAGLACCIGDEAFESTLCAANGASHQNLIQSMRDVLCLVEVEHLFRALFLPWQRNYEIPDETRRKHSLGTRKPTLRLDPADERLYALRFSNPTRATDFKTELGAQALAIPAYSCLPVVPSRRPVSIASRRQGNRVFFHWSLWGCPCTLATVRSLLAAGIDRPDHLRTRGVFAGFRAARVSGDKGKLSFSPSEGVW